MRARVNRAAMAMAVVLAVSACGSTVQSSSQRQLGGGAGGTSGGDGLGGGTGSVPPSLSTTTGSFAPGTTSGGTSLGTSTGTGFTSTSGTTGSAGGTSGGSTSGTGGTTGGAQGPPQATGPGITAQSINIGIGYSSQEAAGNRAIGAGGAAASYDRRDVYNAVIKYANEHGKFGGRNLKPDYRDYALTDQNVQNASACQHWTQDNKTFVIIAQNEILQKCAETAHAIGLGGPSESAKTFKSYPHYVDPFGIRDDRQGTVTVNGLFGKHYFTGKLGLVTWEDPNYKYAMEHSYLPALAAHGISPATPPVYIAVSQDANGVADTSAAMRSAVTKFVSLGIDHVMIVDGPAGVFGGDGLTLEFMQNAKSQQYKPRYGGNSNNFPGNPVNPSDQKDGGLWVDASDYDKTQDAGYHLNQTREACFKIQADAGLPATSSNQADEGRATQACDYIFFLQRVLNRVPVLSADAFVQAVGQLGTSFPSAYTYGTKFTPTKHDGGSLVRVVTWHDACKCVEYLGPPYDAS